MIYYFVAYYADDKAYSYRVTGNQFLPYSPVYRTKYKSREVAQMVARRARRMNPSKRNRIFVDCQEYFTTRK